jgi:hypothetical protein
MVFTCNWNLLKTVTAFSRISQFCILEPSVKGWYSGGRICIFAGDKPIMDKILNFKYHWNQCNCPGTSGTRTHTGGVPKRTVSLCGICGPACHLFSRRFLIRLILRPWIWRRHVPLKRLLTFQGTTRLYIPEDTTHQFSYPKVLKTCKFFKISRTILYRHNRFPYYVHVWERTVVPDTIGKYRFQSF